MKTDASKEFLATIERKQGRYFVLTFPDGQELTVPIHCFSRKAQPGDTIHLQFLTADQAKAERTELARSLLEEILNGN